MEKLKFIQHSAELAKLTGNYYGTYLFTTNDISDQIRKLDTSCSIGTKNEHADRCHVILTSNAILHVILLKNKDVCSNFFSCLVPVTEFMEVMYVG